MKLTEIQFKGYKAFIGGEADSACQKLKLAPLTFVFGKNNSGKSAVVRLPLLLLGGLECNDSRILPHEVRGLSYGANFLDLVYGGDFFGRPSFRIRAAQGKERLDITATLYSQGALAADDPPKMWSYEMRSPESIRVGEPTTEKMAAREFAGLLPADARWDIWRKAAARMLDDAVHVGPLRASIAATYANESFSGFGRSGAGAPQLLRVNGSVADAVSAWYAEHLDGWRLSLKKDSDSFSLRLVKSSSLSTNLALGGEGLQQVLPVVTHQLWRQMQRAQSFVDVIEQPELHLHPAAQAPLADLFIDTARKGSGTTIVETNSEGILLRTQRRIAEGSIRPDQVAIYYVEGGASGSALRKIEILENGEMEWWPSGVFEEDFSEVAAIRRAQRASSDQVKE